MQLSRKQVCEGGKGEEEGEGKGKREVEKVREGGGEGLRACVFCA